MILRINHYPLLIKWIWSLLLLFLFNTQTQPLHGQAGWQVGQTVGLRVGTCIREGPGFGYHAHTRVPEDNWTVMVIDGPRRADGRTWYDTSRRAAGDPSGGTGWVDASQSDFCSESGEVDRPPSTATLPPLPNPGDVRHFDLGSWLISFRSWWLMLPQSQQWVTALVLMSITIVLWRRFAGLIFEFISACLVSVIILWFMELFRPEWQPFWHDLAGRQAPDLALLLASLPFLGWLTRAVGHLLRPR